jgi:hypothetical protein
MRLMTVAVLSAVSLATLAALIPASAQSPQRRYPAGQTESITVIDRNGHRTTRVTVRPRSFLDPGTETKAYEQHYMDYAVQPDRRPGDYLYDRNDWKSSWSRMPFPSCFDLPGSC